MQRIIPSFSVPVPFIKARLRADPIASELYLHQCIQLGIQPVCP